MKFTKEDSHNYDLDWFVVINNTPIHVASDGTDLPHYILTHFEDQLDLRKSIISLPEITEYQQLDVNPNLPILTGINYRSTDYNYIVDAYNDCHSTKGNEDNQYI